MPRTFQINNPLPARGAAKALRGQVVEYLIRHRPAAGEQFLSEYELARVAGISRPTVRKALEGLCQEGWVERRNGVGTFVGPRATAPISAQRPAAQCPSRPGRLAVLVHELGDVCRDWYSPAVLRGLDQLADEHGLAIELVGERDIDAFARRLSQSRPDVLACIAPAARHAMLIGVARQLGIPCIGTGTFPADLGLPTFCEDGAQGAALAVRYLVERGHRSIGFFQMAFAMPLVFHRHRGYLQGLAEAGLEADDRLVLWLDSEDENQQARAIQRYLDRCAPTAVVLGTCWPLVHMAPLIRSGKLRVPQDLSVVNFDQHPRCAEWLDGVSPTVIELPLREMGRCLAKTTRQIVDGTPPTQTTWLACNLREGAAVTQAPQADQQKAAERFGMPNTRLPNVSVGPTSPT